jgi:hypothetical protein
MTMNRKTASLAVCFLAACLGGRADAAVILFDGPLAPTLASFQLLTGAGNVVGGNLPNIGFVADGVLDGTGEAYSGAADLAMAAPSTALFSGFGVQEWTTVLSGPDLALSDREHLVATMPGDVYSMGFEFVEPGSPTGLPNGCNTNPCVDSTFTVTLRNNGSFVHSFTFNALNDQAWFIGVWTDMAFDSMDINETTGGIDNEYFNRFYAGTQPVPEPASLLLFGTGAALLARARRRRTG